MAIANKDKFEKVNPTMIKTLGYTEEELLGNPFLKYVYPDDIESTKKEIELLQKRNATIP